jgi:putative SOS response-associated peptidase YedK
MCGRYVRKSPSAIYAELFKVSMPELRASYNVAPTQTVLAIRQVDGAAEGVLFRWGLVPSWAKDTKAAQINARGETAATKPMFRAAFKKRRCLIVADGYYEWKKLDSKTKQPFYIRAKDDKPIAFAGLWECWKGPDGPVESCAIVTTDANELSRKVHDRMPVILPRVAQAAWLDHSIEDPGALQELVRPYAPEAMALHPVSSAVGNVRNNTPELIEPASVLS